MKTAQELQSTIDSLEQEDTNSWEADRAISYILDLDRQVARLQKSSQQIYVVELQKKIKFLEDELKNKMNEIKRLQLKTADLGLQLGREMNAKTKKE